MDAQQLASLAAPHPPGATAAAETHGSDPRAMAVLDDEAPADLNLDHDEEAQLNSLLDIEETMRLEQMLHDAQDEIDEEGGGFLRDDEEEQQAAAATAAAASEWHTSAGASTAATPVSSAAAAAAAADASSSLEEDAPARPFASGCRECGSIGVQANFLAAFGVSVCFRCQQTHKARYALVTQTTCMSEWMLPLAAVQTLGCIEKKNPHKQAWGVMKLYWRQQVLALVRARFGTREALEAAKRERDLARIRRDDTKRRKAHQSAARSAAFASTLAATMADLAAQTPAEVAALLQARTRGMATTHDARAKEARSKKKRPHEASARTADREEEDDEVVIVDRSPAAAASSRAKKKVRPSSSGSAGTVARKALHTHSFRTLEDGRQQCSDPACHFTMEFESF